MHAFLRKRELEQHFLLTKSGAASACAQNQALMLKNLHITESKHSEVVEVVNPT